MSIGTVRLWKDVGIAVNLSALPARGLSYEPQAGDGREVEETLSVQLSGNLAELDAFAENLDRLLSAAEEGTSTCYVEVQVNPGEWWRSRLLRGRCRRKIHDRARGAAVLEAAWVRADWWEGPEAEHLPVSVYNYQDEQHSNQVLIPPAVQGGMLTPLGYVGEFRQAGDAPGVLWAGVDTGRVGSELPATWIEAESLIFSFYGLASRVESASYSGGAALSVTAGETEAVFAGGDLTAEFLAYCGGRHYKLLAGVRAKTVDGTLRAVLHDGAKVNQAGHAVRVTNKGVIDLGDFRLGDPALRTVANPPKELYIDLKAGDKAAFVLDWLLWMPVDEGFMRLGAEGTAMGTLIRVVLDRESGQAYAEATLSGERSRLAPLGVGLRLNPGKYSRLTFVWEDSSRNLGLNMGFDGLVVKWRPRRRML